MSPETFSINTTDILIYIFSFQIIAHSITVLQRQKREELEPIFSILTQKAAMSNHNEDPTIVLFYFYIQK